MQTREALNIGHCSVWAEVTWKCDQQTVTSGRLDKSLAKRDVDRLKRKWIADQLETKVITIAQQISCLQVKKDTIYIQKCC